MASSQTWAEAPVSGAIHGSAPTPARPVEAPIALRSPDYPRERVAHRGAVLLRRIALPGSVLLAWWIVSALELVPAAVLPKIPDVLAAGWDLLASGQLAVSLGASLTRVLIGVVLGAGLGLALGLVAGLSKAGEDLVDGSLQVVRAIPFLAVIPLFIAWFGIDEQFKVLVIAFATIAPMYAYVYLAVRGIDRRLVEAARGYGLGGAGLIREVVLPLALPGILMALRISLSISIGALIAAENVGTRVGLGYLVSLAQQVNRVDYLFLCVVVYALLGLLFDAVVRLLERILLPWRAGVALR
ncbi:ABC transporter permease [Leucobacter sp. OAMLP11]|uniref:ABC transporter permease n=1 Tax=unclassified Leucobacter TaxID=2621730 RepID=UPI000C19B7BA|nr:MULTISPECIES: ABC transporter permease [unclassified Leucobacter]PIO49379.1 ABC transporter permease [Leucobacter sp. OAMLP11]